MSDDPLRPPSAAEQIARLRGRIHALTNAALDGGMPVADVQQALDTAAAPPSGPIFTLVDLSDLGTPGPPRAYRRDALLAPSSIFHPEGFEVDRQLGAVALWWGGYEYEIDLDRVQDVRDVLDWLLHLTTKKWGGMTPSRLHHLLSLLLGHIGLDVYATCAANDASAMADERAKMVPKLRYAILRRDGFRCATCGATPSGGAHLHVDHILAISRGGKTTPGNLRVLCSHCNHGKGADDAK